MIRTNVSSDGGFAYSENGIHQLSYNAGEAGHLWGPWYWFSED
jgi:hypothetical protein